MSKIKKTIAGVMIVTVLSVPVFSKVTDVHFVDKKDRTIVIIVHDDGRVEHETVYH